MSHARFRWLAATLALLLPVLALAQTPVQLRSTAAGGTIAANGDSVTLNNVGGLASVTVQTLDTYSGTMELQCATDAAQTAFDTDDEVMLTLIGSTTSSTDIVDTVGIYQGNISGCTAVKLIATAGFAATDVTVRLVAITPGGGSSGGGASGSVSIVQGGNTAAVNASSQLSVVCANCSGTGVSANEDTAFAASAAVTPAGSQRQDTLSTDTDVTGDVQPLKGDAAGRLYVTGTGGTFPTSGTAAVDAAVSGNPVYTAGRASAAAPTDVSADGDVVPPWLLRSGAQVVQESFAGVVSVAGNGATTTGTARVTLANDSTGVLATVTNVATIGTSVTPGVGVGNLGKAEDAVAGSGETGVSILAMAQATPTATAADGDYINPKTDANGRLWVNCGAGCSGGTQFAEDLAHTNADVGNFILALRRDTTPSSSATSAGDYTAINADANGRVYTNTTLYTSAGAEITPSTDKAEDAAHQTADTGPVMLARRIDTPATSSSTSGDYSTVDSSAEGALYVTPIASAAVGAGATNCGVTSAASTNSTNCKASAGNVYGFYLVNTTTTVYYLRIYNLGSAPTCSSATGFVQSFPIPPAAAAGGAGGFSFSFPTAWAFSTGVGYCITGGSTSTDNTNAATGIFGILLYK